MDLLRNTPPTLLLPMLLSKPEWELLGMLNRFYRKHFLPHTAPKMIFESHQNKICDDTKQYLHHLLWYSPDRYNWLNACPQLRTLQCCNPFPSFAHFNHLTRLELVGCSKSNSEANFRMEYLPHSLVYFRFDVGVFSFPASNTTSWPANLRVIKWSDIKAVATGEGIHVKFPSSVKKYSHHQGWYSKDRDLDPFVCSGFLGGNLVSLNVNYWKISLPLPCNLQILRCVTFDGEPRPGMFPQNLKVFEMQKDTSHYRFFPFLPSCVEILIIPYATLPEVPHLRNLKYVEAQSTSEIRFFAEIPFIFKACRGVKNDDVIYYRQFPYWRSHDPVKYAQINKECFVHLKQMKKRYFETEFDKT